MTKQKTPLLFFYIILSFLSINFVSAQQLNIKGKAHNGVDTPHKHTFKNNVVNGEVKSVTRTSKDATPMTQQEIRTVRKVLKNRNDGN